MFARAEVRHAPPKAAPSAPFSVTIKKIPIYRVFVRG